MNGIIGTQKLRKYQADVEWYKRNKPEAYSAVNEAVGMMPFTRWMADGQAGSMLRGDAGYTPYVDIEGKLTKNIQEMMKTRGTGQKYSIADNQGYIHEVTVDEMSSADIINYVMGTLSANDRAQMAINGQYSYMTNPDAYSRENVKTMLNGQLESYNLQLGILEAERQTVKGTPREVGVARRIAATRQNMERFRNSGEAILREEGYSGQQAAAFIEAERLAQGMGARFEYYKTSEVLKYDPAWGKREDLAYKAQRDIVADEQWQQKFDQDVIDKQLDRDSRERIANTRKGKGNGTGIDPNNTTGYKSGNEGVTRTDAAVSSDTKTFTEQFAQVRQKVVDDVDAAKNTFLDAMSSVSDQKGIFDYEKQQRGITDEALALYDFFNKNSEELTPEKRAAMSEFGESLERRALLMEDIKEGIKGRAGALMQEINKYAKRLLLTKKVEFDDLFDLDNNGKTIYKSIDPYDPSKAELRVLLKKISAAVDNKLKYEVSDSLKKAYEETLSDLASRYMENKENRYEKPTFHKGNAGYDDLLTMMLENSGNSDEYGSWSKTKRADKTIAIEYSTTNGNAILKMNGLAPVEVSEEALEKQQIFPKREKPGFYPNAYKPPIAKDIRYWGAAKDEKADADKTIKGAFNVLRSSSQNLLETWNENKQLVATEIAGTIMAAMKHADAFEIKAEPINPAAAEGYKFTLTDKDGNEIVNKIDTKIKNWEQVSKEFRDYNQTFMTMLLGEILNDEQLQAQGHSDSYTALLRALNTIKE
jgi:hypothetical protein